MKSNSLTLEDVVIARDGAELSAPISLTLAAGEMLAIHGSNGSGKSTLLKTIAGLLPVHRGVIYRDGMINRGMPTANTTNNRDSVPINGAPTRPARHPRAGGDREPHARTNGNPFNHSHPLTANEQMANDSRLRGNDEYGSDNTTQIQSTRKPLYLGHKRGLTPSMSVYDNVSFWAKAAGYPELTAAALRYFDLQDIPDARVNELSAGWQQRVALTRLITMPASIWLLDEPIANLDAEGVGLLQSLMQSRLEQGGIILVATHLQMQGPNIRILNLSPLAASAQVAA